MTVELARGHHVKRSKQIADALHDTLTSANEIIGDGHSIGLANAVDGLFAVARSLDDHSKAMRDLADAIRNSGK